MAAYMTQDDTNLMDSLSMKTPLFLSDRFRMSTQHNGDPRRSHPFMTSNLKNLYCQTPLQLIHLLSFELPVNIARFQGFTVLISD